MKIINVTLSLIVGEKNEQVILNNLIALGFDVNKATIPICNSKSAKLRQAYKEKFGMNFRLRKDQSKKNIHILIQDCITTGISNARLKE